MAISMGPQRTRNGDSLIIPAEAEKQIMEIQNNTSPK
jgi:hypothetical protein